MSESTYQLILALLGAFPIVCSIVVAIARAAGWTRLAGVIEGAQPFAVRAMREALKKPEETKNESKKDPPDDPPTAAAPGAVVLGSVLVALLAGCSAAQQVAQLSAEIIRRAEPCLMAQYEAQQEQCLELHSDAERRGCVADVQAGWKPIIDGLVELRTVRCEIEPAKCEGEK